MYRNAARQSLTRNVVKRSWREPFRSASLLGLAALAAVGCASTSSAGSKNRELVMSYDDSRPGGTIAFPTQGYESVLRFDLPAGEHRPLRLRLQAESPGTVEINIYDSTPLETPGDILLTISRDLQKEDLSDGRDGRWVVEDLAHAKPLKGVIWVGIRKAGGEPTLWSSSSPGGQCFIRNNDPKNLMGLLPTKRTPMLRLEVTP
jgi:hypothetical protein